MKVKGNSTTTTNQTPQFDHVLQLNQPFRQNKMYKLNHKVLLQKMLGFQYQLMDILCSTKKAAGEKKRKKEIGRAG